MKFIFTILTASVFFAAFCGRHTTYLPVANAAKPVTENTAITEKEAAGFTYGNVHCGLQDRQGRMWFGTTGNGVYRIDGEKVTNFTVKEGLNSNNVYAVLEARDGSIWFGTEAGVCRYDGKTIAGVPVSEGSASYYYLFSGAAQAIAKIPVWSLMQDNSGRIWLGTGNDGVYCYDRGNFSHFLHDDNVANKDSVKLRGVCSMIQAADGDIWITTWFEGICRYDGKQITAYRPNGEVWFASLLQDSRGRIWAGTRSHGVYVFDGQQFALPFAGTRIFNECGGGPMYEDRDGHVWIGTEAGNMVKRDEIGGVWRYDPKTNSMENLTVKDGLHNYCIFCIVPDKSGNLWIGSRGMGLCIYDGKKITDISSKVAGC